MRNARIKSSKPKLASRARSGPRKATLPKQGVRRARPVVRFAAESPPPPEPPSPPPPDDTTPTPPAPAGENATDPSNPEGQSTDHGTDLPSLGGRPEGQTSLNDLLQLFKGGDAVAGEALFKFLIEVLRKIAAHLMKEQRRGHTLGVTGLVGEALLKLLGYDRQRWPDKVHSVLNLLATSMRQVLVDYARTRNREKRGGGAERLFIEDVLSNLQINQCDFGELDEALTRLMAIDPRAAQVVQFKFIIGLTWAEIAEVLQISESTALRDWEFARAWLRRALE